MDKIAKAGRIFYGIAIADIGIQTICDKDFPYMMLPPKHLWIPGFTVIAIIGGLLLALAGACIVFEKWARQASLLLGTVLLLIFCFWFVPYQFITGTNYMHLALWENAEKELALAGGALVVAGCFTATKENPIFSFLGALVPFGAIFYSITLISFGIIHFLYAKEASALVPTWIAGPMFWVYFAGVALIGSGVAIILKIKIRLIAALAGIMMLLWFLMLHIPRVIVSPAVYLSSEIVSAFLAFAYSGIAFVIAGKDSKKKAL